MKVNLVWSNTIALLVVLSILLPGCFGGSNEREIHYIGVPDGAAGLLVRYVLQEKMTAQKIKTVTFESYTMYDCCASASMYALGSGHLDIAIMCPEAARNLAQRDSRFVIAGPVIINSDVLIARDGTVFGDAPIGVSQKRIHQHKIIDNRLGDRGKAAPMLHSAVPFAYSKGVVNGAVLDIIRSFELPGAPVPRGENEQDITTYVLVTKKTLLDSSQYQSFMEMYCQAVREMEDSSRVFHLLKNYASTHITKGDIKTWIKMNVHFTYPSTFHPQG